MSSVNARMTLGRAQAFAFLTLLFLLLCPSRGRADGFIVITDGPRVPHHFSFAPLEVKFHNVNVTIDNDIATTEVDEEFYNPNPQRLEGTYLFPLPAGAHIDKFAMDVNGSMVDAELLSADKARAVYEDIVRRAKDPALLEYIGRDAFKVRIFPIEPNAGKRIKIKYTQLLTTESGLTEYVYPLNTEKFSSKPLDVVSIKVDLTTKQPLKNVYCVSHNVDKRLDGGHHAVIGYEDRNVRPDTDFKLIFTREEKEIGINLLTYKAGGDDGYFLLMASPGAELKNDRPQAKDICFVLDNSGSMAGPKMEQAKKALNFCLANLNPDDRFEVVRFSTEVEPFFNELKSANKENIDKATDFIGRLHATGATALDEALKKALALSKSQHGDRPYEIVFLTDGQPTIGQTNEDAIVADIKAANADTRIFTFGIGNDVNTHLLDRVAEGTNGFSQYVLPQEDIELKVSNFYAKVKEPVLSNVQVSVTGDDVRLEQMYPGKLPDLFKGQTLTAFGRYHGHGAAAIKISGTFMGQQKVFTTDVNFTDSDSSHAFIPQLWATRRVGWLLDEIRMHGESAELKDEVTQLARRWGIVTPYTAYLIMEDESHRQVPLSEQTLREFNRDDQARAGAKDMYDHLRSEAANENSQSGARAVDNARNINQLAQGQTMEDAGAAQQQQQAQADAPGGSLVFRSMAHGQASTQPSGYRQSTNYAQQARVINGRAFYQNADNWSDVTWQTHQDASVKKIKFNSEEYFDLLKRHPEAAEWLALGDNVDLMLDGVLYQVRPE